LLALQRSSSFKPRELFLVKHMRLPARFSMLCNRNFSEGSAVSTPKITDMFGIDFPLFAFTHCRDVVVAVSKAGGMGVFGALHYTPEQLKEELTWIEEHIDGLPYAIDLVMPAKFVRAEGGEEFDGSKLWELIPEGHQQFAKEICDRHGVPELPEDVELRDTSSLAWSERVAREQLDIALEFSPSLLVNALGEPPEDVSE